MRSTSIAGPAPATGASPQAGMAQLTCAGRHFDSSREAHHRKLVWRLGLGLFLGFAVWSLGFSTAFGQGTAFTYQGRLSDSGSPAQGLYDLRFRIFDFSAGGTAVGGPLTNSSLAIADGLFTASLDFVPGVFN